MRKKRSRQSGRAARKPTKPQQQDPASREREALAALANGRWRDAIVALKALLKEDAAGERTPARRLALADAYAGRARELSGKGMLKEALAIWDNRAALGPEVPPALEHAALKLRLGDPEQLLALWSRAGALSRDERQQVGARLAAAVLAGDASLPQKLADDDPVRRHAEPARAALAAYCAADDANLEAALADIPFRSPYRDVALLLKALSRMGVEPETSRATLARIGDDSAFAPLRRVAEAALLPDTGFLAALGGLGPRQAELAAALRGWSAEQLALAQALASLDASAAAPAGTDAAGRQAMLRLLQRHRDLLGADWAGRAEQRLLLSGARPGRGASGRGRRAPAHSMSAVDAALFQARQTEAEHRPWAALEAWGAFAAALIEAKETPSDDPNRRLAIALALRRTDQYLDLLGTQAPHPEALSDQSTAAAQLERSLDWDPDHRETYLRLIGWYRRTDRLKDARRVLSAAQDRWPRDMAVLEAALDLALAGSAFKKAAGLARQMLEIDPINSGARRRLVDAHISHAAKQMPKNRLDLAAKELRQARQWTERGASLDTLRERLDLLEALVQLDGQNLDAARTRVQELLAQRGPASVGQVELALTAALLKLDQHQLAKLLRLRKAKARNQTELALILARLRDFAEQRDHYSGGLVERLTTLLKGAPWKSLEAEQLELACETFRRMRLSDARREAAGAALKRWPQAPVFAYHALESKYAGRGMPSAADSLLLERALERAEHDGDARMVNRLLSLREQLWPFSGLPMLDFPGPSDDFPGEPQDSNAAAGLDALLDALDHLPLEQVLAALDLPKRMRKQLLKIARAEGEAEVIEILKDMARESGDSFDDRRDAQAGARNPRKPTEGPSKQLDLF